MKKFNLQIFDTATGIDRTGAEALIPEERAQEIIQGTIESSAVLSMGRKLANMTAQQSKLPVLDSLPVAYFVDGDAGQKKTTKMAWDKKVIYAEEVAVIVPIPEAVLDDSDYDIWGEVKPRVQEAFGKVIDEARYTDDIHAIHPSRAFLEEFLEGFREIAKEYDLIINEKKTRICPIDKPFRILKVQYWLTDSGKVVRKINPKSITRERRKLKAYRRLLDAGRIDYETVENSFKSWIGDHWKLMSMQQINNMSALYYELFKRRITWKKGHGRLNWLMGQPWRGSVSTATTMSAQRSSQLTTSRENSRT